MHGLAWPIGPVLGQVFKGFAFDGRQWRATRMAEWSNVQVFRFGGRYTPSPDLIYAVVECIGAGGGGGWCRPISGIPPAGESNAVAAGGGGSGGYSRKIVPADLLIQGADVLVGSGGIVMAGAPGGGITGSDTNFGGLCVAHAGGDAQATDGLQTIAGAYGQCGAGAAVGIGDFCEPGACGGMWAGIVAVLAQGRLPGAVPGFGGQLFGGATQPVVTAGANWILSNTNGGNGLPNSGAGGGGGQTNSGTSTSFGGNGGSGLVIVTEVCADGSGGGGGGGGGSGLPPGVPVNIDAKVLLREVPWVPPPTEDP